MLIVWEDSFRDIHLRSWQPPSISGYGLYHCWLHLVGKELGSVAWFIVSEHDVRWWRYAEHEEQIRFKMYLLFLLSQKNHYWVIFELLFYFTHEVTSNDTWGGCYLGVTVVGGSCKVNGAYPFIVSSKVETWKGGWHSFLSVGVQKLIIVEMWSLKRCALSLSS